MRKTGGEYRDQYFDDYKEYLRRKFDTKRKEEGKSYTQILQLIHLPQILFILKGERIKTLLVGLRMKLLLMKQGRNYLFILEEEKDLSRMFSII